MQGTRSRKSTLLPRQGFSLNFWWIGWMRRWNFKIRSESGLKKHTMIFLTMILLSETPTCFSRNLENPSQFLEHSFEPFKVALLSRCSLSSSTVLWISWQLFWPLKLWVLSSTVKENSQKKTTTNLSYTFLFFWSCSFSQQCFRARQTFCNSGCLI